MNNRTRTELILEEKLDTECVWSFKTPRCDQQGLVALIAGSGA